MVDLKLKFSNKLITLGVLYGVTFGVMGIHLNNYTRSIISTSTILVILKWLSTRRIHVVVIMYVIYFIYGMSIQILLLLILYNIFFNQTFIFLLTQILTLLIFIYSYKQFSLHKLFNIIQKELLIELLIFNISIIIFFLRFILILNIPTHTHYISHSY